MLALWQSVVRGRPAAERLPSGRSRCQRRCSTLAARMCCGWRPPQAVLCRWCCAELDCRKRLAGRARSCRESHDAAPGYDAGASRQVGLPRRGRARGRGRGGGGVTVHFGRREHAEKEGRRDLPLVAEDRRRYVQPVAEGRKASETSLTPGQRAAPPGSSRRAGTQSRLAWLIDGATAVEPWQGGPATAAGGKRGPVT